MRTLLIFGAFLLLFSCSNEEFNQSPPNQVDPFIEDLGNRDGLNQIQTLIKSEVYDLTLMSYDLPENYTPITQSQLDNMTLSEVLSYLSNLGINTNEFTSIMQNLNTYYYSLIDDDLFAEAAMAGAIQAINETYSVIGLDTGGDELETRATPCYDQWKADMIEATAALAVGAGSSIYTANPLPVIGGGIYYLAASYSADVAYRNCMRDRYPNWGG